MDKDSVFIPKSIEIRNIIQNEGNFIKKNNDNDENDSWNLESLDLGLGIVSQEHKKEKNEESNVFNIPLKKSNFLPENTEKKEKNNIIEKSIEKGR